MVGTENSLIGHVTISAERVTASNNISGFHIKSTLQGLKKN